MLVFNARPSACINTKSSVDRTAVVCIIDQPPQKSQWNGVTDEMNFLGGIFPASGCFSHFNLLIMSLFALAIIIVGIALCLVSMRLSDAHGGHDGDATQFDGGHQDANLRLSGMTDGATKLRYNMWCRDLLGDGHMDDGTSGSSTTMVPPIGPIMESPPHCGEVGFGVDLAEKCGYDSGSSDDMDGASCPWDGVECPLQVEAEVVVSEVGYGAGDTLSLGPSGSQCVIGITPLSPTPSLDGTMDSLAHPHQDHSVHSLVIDPTWEMYMLDSGASVGTLKSPLLSHTDSITRVISIGTASKGATPLVNTTSGYSSFVDEHGSVVHFGASRTYGGVKGASKNLFSVMDYVKAGGRVHFEDYTNGEYCRAWSNDGDQMEVVIINNLPYLKLQQLQPNPSVHMQDTEFKPKQGGGMTLSMLHWVLAHSDIQMLADLPQYVDGLEVIPDKAGFSCQGHGCKLGKAKHVNFPRNIKPRTMAVGAEISADYKSSKAPSIIRRNTGFFLCKDRASRFEFMFSSRNKSAKTQIFAFKRFRSYLLKYHHYVRHVNFDGGGEFLAAEFITYLDEASIDYTYTNTDTPQQNSIIERDIQTVSNKSDAQLQGMQAGDCFWELSTIVVVGVDNCCVESRNPTFPPLEWVTGARVDMAKYQLPFFCVVFVLRTDRLKSESRKARPGLFVGFPQHQRGILAYIPALHRLVATVNYTCDLTITTKAQRHLIDWQGDSSYLGGDADDSVWESTEYDDVTPHQHVDVTVSPRSTPRRPTPTPDGGHQMDGEILDFDVTPPIGAPLPTGVSPSVPSNLTSTPDFNTSVGGHFGINPDGGTTVAGDGTRASTRPTAPPDVLTYSHMVEGLEQLQPGVKLEEQQYLADVAYYSMEGNVQAKVTSQGDVGVQASVESADMHAAMMVHLTQHAALPPTSSLPSLRGTMSEALRHVVGNEPKGVKRALSCPHFGACWKQAMDKEFASLIENGTFSLKPIAEVEQVKRQYPNDVTLMWTHIINVCKTMDGGAGSLVLDKFKSRVVVEGNWMTRLLDFTSSFSPVVSMDTLKVLLALAVTWGMTITSIDFVTAFLQADVDGEHVYAYMPKGYEMYDEHGNALCMHLHKNLHGVVQASRMFFLTVREWLADPLPLDQGGCGMQWHQLSSDQCVFYTVEDGQFCILAFYIDDVACFSTCEWLRKKVLASIQSRFKVEDKGPLQWFLGMMVTHSKEKGTLTLSVKASMLDKIKQFGLENVKPVKTPLKQKQAKGDDGLLSSDDATMFRSMVGCLIWYMLARPDIMEATSECTTRMHAPTNKDMTMAIRVYAYLSGSINKLLTYSQEGMAVEMDMGCAYKSDKGSWGLVAGYVDANLAKPMSQTGLCFKAAGGTVVARTKKQPVPAIQTYDSELYGWSLACCAGIWLWMMLTEVNHLFDYQLLGGPIVIHGDHASVIRTVQEQAISTKARHIALRWYHFMHALKHKVLEAHWISGKCNPANCLSKGPESNQGFLDEADDLL